MLQGLFNSGSTIGAIIAPATVPYIAIHYGWKWAFIITGLLGFVWLLFWWVTYERPSMHKKITIGELNYINNDNEIDSREKVRWSSLLNRKETWGFVIGKFLTDPVWYFYLFWLPSYLSSNGLNMGHIGWPIILVYSVASLGSVGGGWLPSKFMQTGWSVNKSRKTAMLIFALLASVSILIRFSDHLWLSIFLISLATAAHTGWSANIFTLVSDQFPRNAISTVVGIGSMAGAIGGILFARGIGLLLDHFETAHRVQSGYDILFIICGVAYIISLGLIHLLSPKLKAIII